MRGPCMCGDIYCPSCGPAQGNSKCPHCGKWSMDGGCDNPEACALAENEYADGMYRQILIDKCLEKEMKKQHKRFAGDLELPSDWFSVRESMPIEQLKAEAEG